MPVDVIAQPSIVIGAALFGLVFGSFVTALSFRLPRNVSIADGRSRCPACGHELAFQDLIPVLSWLAHKGACRYCGAAISTRYPIIEMTSMMLFVAASLMVPLSWSLAILLLATPLMLALAVIDIEHQVLPNGLMALLLMLALAWRWQHGSDLLAAVAAGALMFFAGFALDGLFRAATKQSGLGLGDVKLMAIMAVGLSTPVFFAALTLAGGIGLVLGVIWLRRTGRRSFPFGPPLLFSLWLSMGLPMDRWLGTLS